jgi:hypothetical protein
MANTGRTLTVQDTFWRCRIGVEWQVSQELTQKTCINGFVNVLPDDPADPGLNQHR